MKTHCPNHRRFLASLAFNQLVNHASKMHYMDNGKTTVPMVVWAEVIGEEVGDSGAGSQQGGEGRV